MLIYSLLVVKEYLLSVNFLIVAVDPLILIFEELKSIRAGPLVYNNIGNHDQEY